MSSYFAGGDWSGKPDKDDFLVFSLAASDDSQSWSEHCSKIRQQLGMAQHAEFHARDMTEQDILILLTAARESGMVFGALVLEKIGVTNTEAPIAFDYASVAQELFRGFVLRYSVKRIWYDTEIQGRAAEKAFETEMCRINRAIYPNAPLKARCRPSNKSDLIQVADSVAYVVSRQTRGLLKHTPLQQLWAAIAADERNLIIRL